MWEILLGEVDELTIYGPLKGQEACALTTRLSLNILNCFQIRLFPCLYPSAQTQVKRRPLSAVGYKRPISQYAQKAVATATGAPSRYQVSVWTCDCIFTYVIMLLQPWLYWSVPTGWECNAVGVRHVSTHTVHFELWWRSNGESLFSQADAGPSGGHQCIIPGQKVPILVR